MPDYYRVALFIDYENVCRTLKERSVSLEHEFGYPPELDFDTLINRIRERFGALKKEDCIAAFNSSHYDPQKGGLNRYATIINVDSFQPRHLRQLTQPSPGKKYVEKNFADMRLAYEIGFHATNDPAQLYLIFSGDGDFAPVAEGLIAKGHEVRFLVPDYTHAAMIIKEKYPLTSYDELVPKPDVETLPSEIEEGQNISAQDVEKITPNPVDELCYAVSKLRQTFTTSIPLSLIKVLPFSIGMEHLLQLAQGKKRIDIWEDQNGVPCISLREERMRGKIHKIPSRLDLVEKADQLRLVALIKEQNGDLTSRPGWRKAFKKYGGLSNKNAKKLLQQLLNSDILQDGDFQYPDLSLVRVIAFLEK